MSFDVDLSPHTEVRLRTQAAALGMSLESYVAKLLEETADSTAGKLSGPELIEYWQREGVLGMRQDILDSSGHASKLRARI